MTMKCDECGKKAVNRCMLCGAIFCTKCSEENGDECLYCEPVLRPIKDKKISKKNINHK